jgi:hypothetical protein
MFEYNDPGSKAKLTTGRDPSSKARLTTERGPIFCSDNY